MLSGLQSDGGKLRGDVPCICVWRKRELAELFPRIEKVRTIRRLLPAHAQRYPFHHDPAFRKPYRKLRIIRHAKDDRNRSASLYQTRTLEAECCTDFVEDFVFL